MDTKLIHTTTSQSNIRMVDKEISLFLNEYGKRTPILIVARAMLDQIEYAALYDTSTRKRYVVEIVRSRSGIKEFRDLDQDSQDEEWAIISNYFLKEKVYENNKIQNWIKNTVLRQKLSLGTAVIPGTVMKRNMEKYNGI